MSNHMTESDRIRIAAGLDKHEPINQIAKAIGKDRSTVSREIRKHSVQVDVGAKLRVPNRCVFRTTCTARNVCVDRPDCTRKCAACKHCNTNCPDFEEEHCILLQSPPYVCNGCTKYHNCVLMKTVYYPDKAQKEYRATLSESREGYNMTTLELRHTDQVVSPLLKQGQSIHHIYIHNSSDLTVSESTISRLVKDQQLTATVLDQPRVCKLKPRKSSAPAKKVDRRCREGRTLADYHVYIEAHPGAAPVEMDTVIGRKGGKCLMTLIFPKSELMLAFLNDCNTAAAVQSRIEFLYSGLKDDFARLFPVILTDNGSEFSNPAAIELARDGAERTRVFYCDPMASWQKPHVERNHELIRCILPKGTSFDHLSQSQINLMMSHINSYSRPSLGDKNPFEVFAFLHGDKCLERLLLLTCQTVIPPKEIILKPSLLR